MRQRKPLNLVVEGDSLTVGEGASAGHDYPTLAAAILGAGLTLTNFAVGGSTLTTEIPARAATVAAAAIDKPSVDNVCVLWAGTNDMKALSLSGADTYALYSAYCQDLRDAGYFVVAVSVLPRNGPTHPVGFEAERLAFNALLDAGWTGFADAYANVAADSRFAAGAWADNSYYYDGVHLTDRGYARVAAIVADAVESIVLTSPMSAYSKYLAISDTLRGEVSELELVTRLTLADGTTQQITNTRRAVCKKATRKGITTILEFADIDRSSLDRVFPFKQFTVADFPGLYVDHVGWRIPQGVGTVTKVPMAWIATTATEWTYAGTEVVGGAGTVAAVYRGTTMGQGAVVDASEYTVSTSAGASTGVQVLTVVFAREQLDFNGKPYVIEIDASLPGSRYASAETSRILTLFGVTVDATTFGDALTADTAAGSLVDALYGSRTTGRTGAAIIEDLLGVARGWLSQTATGAWGIVQDVARASSYEFDAATDLIDVGEYGDGNIPATVALQYRPATSGLEDFTGNLSRSTVGASGEMRLSNPYIRDHTVADKLLSYWQLRLNTLREASASIHALQLANGNAIDVTYEAAWGATAKKFIITGIRRPADKNAVKLREYDAAIYTYVPGTLPADATNTYTPDYSYTLPAAPAALTNVSSGQSADTDGKVTAYIKLRVTPPSVNWAVLWVLVVDTTTNEEHFGQFQLVGGNYDVVIGGLRPNRAHNAYAWAVNGNNVKGTVTGALAFTSANATTALAAPTTTVTQVQSKEVKVELSAVVNVAGQPNWLQNILFEKVGAGAYAEVKRDKSRTYIRTVVTGTTYYYKSRSEDMNHNESADSAEVSITAAKMVDDTYIPTGGVSDGSIADGSINRGRSDTGTGSSTGTASAGTTTYFSMDVFSFFPCIEADSGVTWFHLTAYDDVASIGDDTGRFAIRNDGSTDQYSFSYRTFNP